MEHYRNFSQEELRLADYQQGRTGFQAVGQAGNIFPPTLSDIAQSAPKPGDFGSGRYIEWPKASQVYIHGISPSQPVDINDINAVKRLQRAMVQLCILAEIKCWPELYNAAVEEYIRGELNLCRPIPVDHVDRIYERTHGESRYVVFIYFNFPYLYSFLHHMRYLCVSTCDALETISLKPRIRQSQIMLDKHIPLI
jgi:hypothetical protein